MKKSIYFLLVAIVFPLAICAQETSDDQTEYKKRVLESTEVDFLSSYYSQDGQNAAVSGGIGTEELTDITGTVVVAIPLNEDDVLTIDSGISAYTSASSSNIDPFDEAGADPFTASSGASQSDLWANGVVSYSHSSDDRNALWNAKLSVASEYDYFSVGFGGGYTRLFNEKNTELSIHGSVYLDSWKTIYPIELRPFDGNGGLNNPFFDNKNITGNPNYAPVFTAFDSKSRNSYAAGLGFSQILSRNMQASLALDVVLQDGLLSTPFQRVYFRDFEDSFIEDFHLADDVERLPNTRFKIAAGGRLHYFFNEFLTLRTFYRYYSDDWGISSHTASAEVPVKISQSFTLYPSYRYYTQTAADYFAPYNEHLSTEEFYTSDYDLSAYHANQYGFGVGYTDIFTKAHLWHFGLKSFDLKYYYYKRNSSFSSGIVTGGVKFIMD